MTLRDKIGSMARRVDGSRLLVLTYKGDYRLAYRRLRAGGPETYFGQRHSVEVMVRAGQKIDEVVVLTFVTDDAYDEVLTPGLRAIGLGGHEFLRFGALLSILSKLNPSHIFQRTLSGFSEVLAFSALRRVKLMVCLAESIPRGGVRHFVRGSSVSTMLNAGLVQWLGIYGSNLSRFYERMGVDPSKIIPFHYTASERHHFAPRKLAPGRRAFRLFFVGSLVPEKGIGDLIRAVSILERDGFPVRLHVAGRDADDRYQKLARALGCSDCVDFLGMVPNGDLLHQMRRADAVVVPSRPRYPEGFPLAITHSLEARTPVIVSDHPMFLEELRHEQNAVVAPAANSVELAKAIAKLASSPRLYSTLSRASADTLRAMDVPVRFEDLLLRWLFDSTRNRAWFQRQSLASHRRSWPPDGTYGS